MLRRTMALGLVCGLLGVPGARAEDEAEHPYARRGWYVGMGFGLALGQFEDEYRKPRYLTTTGEGILSDESLGTAATPGDKFRIEPPGDEANGTPDFIELSLSDRFAFNVRGGYRFHPHFAVEGQYEYVDRFEVLVTENIPFKNSLTEAPDPNNPGELLPTRTFVRQTNTNLTIQPQVLTANVRGYLTTGRFQPHLLLGAGAAWTETNNAAREEVVSHLDFTMRFGGGLEYYITDHIVIACAVSYVYPLGFLQDKADYISVDAMAFHYRF